MPEVYSTFALIAVLCRAEAKKLYASKPAFDELGVRLVVAVHQMPKPELEVKTCMRGLFCIGILLKSPYRFCSL